MKSTRILIVLSIIYLLWCGYLITESGFFSKPSPQNGPMILLQQPAAADESQMSIADVNEISQQAKGTINLAPAEPASKVRFDVENTPEKTFIIGADDPNSEDPEIDASFKLQIELTTKGAGISKATFSNGNGNGFDDRDPKNPKPFVLMSPVSNAEGRLEYAMASSAIVFPEYGIQLRLDKLNFQCVGIEKTPEGCDKATFVAIIKDADTDKPAIKLTKVFDLMPNSYMMDCHICVENLSARKHKFHLNMNGPLGMSREDIRTDMRKATGAFVNSQGEIQSTTIDLRKARKAKTADDLRLKLDNSQFLWAAVSNKYFAAIAVPVPPAGDKYSNWISDKSAQLYNPEADRNIGTNFTIAENTLAPAGSEQSQTEYKFQVYLGPKDKQMFDDNDYYKELGFFHVIDFMSCCCPASIINPLAFFIMWLMNSLYNFIPNYGIVIIILVFIVRLVLHPVTKAGQIRMSRFTKILSAPEVQEIKAKYAKNRMEMQKRISEFQKSRGVSPTDALFGMVPMLVQMPLWIALWSSVNSSINLRGAGFLPFWITDLSVPDALISFPTVTIPLLGWKISSFNLLPILMGVAFYLQQKTMPQQAAATPEQQQQQKMMKIMMLALFPIMLYQAPSGVSLYIMASSFAGAIEQYVIKKHIREKEEAESRGLVEVTSKTGGKIKKKKPKPFIKY